MNEQTRMKQTNMNEYLGSGAMPQFNFFEFEN